MYRSAGCYQWIRIYCWITLLCDGFVKNHVGSDGSVVVSWRRFSSKWHQKLQQYLEQYPHFVSSLGYQQKNRRPVPSLAWLFCKNPSKQLLGRLWEARGQNIRMQPIRNWIDISEREFLELSYCQLNRCCQVSQRQCRFHSSMAMRIYSRHQMDISGLSQTC